MARLASLPQNLSRISQMLIRKSGYLLLIISILGGILRALGLDRTLWFDEAVLFWIATGNIHSSGWDDFLQSLITLANDGSVQSPSWSNVLNQNRALNSAPPLYPMLVHLLISWSTDEPFIRLASYLAGVASIPMTYLLARHWLSVPVALGVALLVAVSPTQVAYSYELREYSLTYFLAATLIWTTIRYLKWPTWKNAGIVSVLMCLCLVTQYGLALLLLALNGVTATAIAFAQEHRGSRLLRWSMAQIPPLCTVLLVYTIALSGQMRADGFAADSYLSHAYWDGSLGSLPYFTAYNSLWIMIFTFGSKPVVIVGSICLLATLWSIRSRPGNWLLAACLLGPILITYTASLLRLYPYHGGRQIIYLTPMLYVGVGTAIDFILATPLWKTYKRLQPSIMAIVLIAILTLPSFQHSVTALQTPGWEEIRPIAAWLATAYKEGDDIYVHYAAVPAFRYYYRDHVAQWRIGFAPGQTRYLNQLQTTLANSQRVWLVFSHINDPMRNQVLSDARALRGVDVAVEAPGAWLYVTR